MKLKKMMSCGLAIISMFSTITAASAAVPIHPASNVPQAAQTEAAVKAQQEALVKEAKTIAYADVVTASEEMKARILDARETIINSESWVADGYEGSITDKSGVTTPLPHFSELFPGWDVPVAQIAETAAPDSPVDIQSTQSTQRKYHIGVPLRNPSSTTLTSPFFT